MSNEHPSVAPPSGMAQAASAFAPDLAAASGFLELLDPRGVFTFQTFDGTKREEKEGRLAGVLHGRFTDHASGLTALNQVGAGIYVMVNEGDGRVHEGQRTCRTNANVIRVRANYVDLDNAPVDLEPLLTAPIPPDIIVESSPTKYQAYWLSEGCPLEQFSGIQKGLIERYGGDKAVHDLCRVLRVPGFWHQKGTPFLVRVVYLRGVKVG